jgi:hypothetical protein
MMVFPMRRKFLRADSPNSTFAKQKSVEKRERERERETLEELGYGPCAHSNALSLLLLLNDLIFYLPRTSNGDHILIYQGRQCTEIRHVSIRLDITSPSIQSSFLCPHTTGPTGHLPDCSKSSLPTCNSYRRLWITRFEDRTGLNRDTCECRPRREEAFSVPKNIRGDNSEHIIPWNAGTNQTRKKTQMDECGKRDQNVIIKTYGFSLKRFIFKQ